MKRSLTCAVFLLAVAGQAPADQITLKNDLLLTTGIKITIGNMK